jgi:hypothetical protein
VFRYKKAGFEPGHRYCLSREEILFKQIKVKRIHVAGRTFSQFRPKRRGIYADGQHHSAWLFQARNGKQFAPGIGKRVVTTTNLQYGF